MSAKQPDKCSGYKSNIEIELRELKKQLTESLSREDLLIRINELNEEYRETCKKLESDLWLKIENLQNLIENLNPDRSETD